jgi:hypothetical protein
MLISRMITIVLGLSGLHALASCSEPPRLAEGSVTVKVDGPDRIEGRRAYVTQTLTNTGSEPVCFMYDADLGFVPGGFTHKATGQDYLFRTQGPLSVNSEGEFVPSMIGVKARIEPGETFVRQGLTTSIDEFYLRAAGGQLQSYRSGDLVVFGSGEQFFPCIYDDIIDAGVNFIVVEGVSRPFAFN